MGKHVTELRHTTERAKSLTPTYERELVETDEWQPQYDDNRLRTVVPMVQPNVAARTQPTGNSFPRMSLEM